MPILTREILCSEAEQFSRIESQNTDSSLYRVTDGKAVGTFLERKFKAYLLEKYEFVAGNSAKGIDFPELLVDMKVTSIKQPQSSCPFKSARQKIFGLGYSLIIFVYEKIVRKVFNLLNSQTALDFYSCLIFWDEKRPIKTGVLNSLDLDKLEELIVE